MSVIVLNRGPERAVIRTLDSLFGQTYTDFETIVVEDSPNDGAVKLILARWPQTIVLKSHADLGFCRAANLAAEIALGKYVLFLASNAWLNRTALGKLVEVMESEPAAGVVGPLILNEDGSLKAIGMKMSKPAQPVPNKETFGADVEVIDDIFSVPGAVMMVDKSLFASLNGFDEAYFSTLEDADICWRTKLLGRRVIINPWSIAYCAELEAADSNDYLRHRNTLRMIIKNYAPVRAILAALQFLSATLLKSTKSLVALKPDLFWRYWRAVLWNFRMFPDSIRQRRRVQRRRRQNDKFVLKNAEEARNYTSQRAA